MKKREGFKMFHDLDIFKISNSLEVLKKDKILLSQQIESGFASEDDLLYNEILGEKIFSLENDYRIAFATMVAFEDNKERLRIESENQFELDNADNLDYDVFY